jgi:D-sedoheptulose 7-phosphate isomerase
MNQDNNPFGFAPEEINAARNRQSGYGEYIREVSRSLLYVDREQIRLAISILKQALGTNRHVYIFGNGGSATTASHFACDLNKSAKLKAFALTDIALTTAWANDRNYIEVFANQIDHLIEPNDVAIGISASGESLNVLDAIEVAKNKGAHTIGFSGEGGRLKYAAEVAITVPSSDIEQIEDAHLIICHIITKCLREV